MTERNAPALSRKQQREYSKTRILDAAIELFAQAGFDAASLSGIAKRAGVKKALVQYHFATKEFLWQEAVTRVWTQRNQQLAEFLTAHGNDDPQARMREAFVAVVKISRHKPHWLWFMFHEGAANGERLQWLVDNFMNTDYEQGQNFIRDYQARGLIRKGSPLQLIHLISGALTYNLLVAPQTLRATKQNLMSEAAIAEQVDLLMEMLTP